MLSGLPAGRGMLVTAAIRDVSERLALAAERERLRAAAQQERFGRRTRQFQRLESLGRVQVAAQQAIQVTRQLQTFAGHEAATVHRSSPAEPRQESPRPDPRQHRARPLLSQNDTATSPHGTPVDNC